MIEDIPEDGNSEGAISDTEEVGMAMHTVTSPSPYYLLPICSTWICQVLRDDIQQTDAVCTEQCWLMLHVTYMCCIDLSGMAGHKLLKKVGGNVWLTSKVLLQS